MQNTGQGYRWCSNRVNSCNKFTLTSKIFGLVQLTLASSQAALDSVDQRVFALVAEGTTEVIQVQRPHHSTSKVVFLQPVNL